MSKGRHVRAFDYVNQPYEKVRDALHESAEEILLAATKSAASRANSVASGLHVNIGGIEVGAEISIDVESVEDDPKAPLGGQSTRLHLSWEAAKTPGLFPLMNGSLSVYALSATETQLDFEGDYEPPLGVVGAALDAAVGHRIAEASVHRFISDVAAHLRDELKG
ncbi:MAG: hypothetical protein PVJ80_13290 [Gemmatimonadota bacterium]|jgi:hypothetical protein